MILKVNEGKVDPVNVKVATIDSASRTMKMLSREEVTAKVEKLAKEWQA